MKKYYIFDMDGTLADSMVSWHSEIRVFRKAEEEKAAREGRKSPFKEKGSIMNSPAESAIMEPVFERMREHYRETEYKEGALKFLEKAKQAGIRMCIATGTRRDVAEPFLEKSGILDYMEFYVDCFEVGAFKDYPDVYLAAAERLGADIKDCAVFEDSTYSAQTAKNAGFYIVGVYDDETSREGNLEEISDLYIRDWNSMCERELP